MWRLSKVLVTSAIALGYVTSIFAWTWQALANNIDVSPEDTVVTNTYQVASTNTFGLYWSSTTKESITKNLTILETKIPDKMKWQLKTQSFSSIMKRIVDQNKQSSFYKKLDELKAKYQNSNNISMVNTIEYIKLRIQLAELEAKWSSTNNNSNIIKEEPKKEIKTEVTNTKVESVAAGKPSWSSTSEFAPKIEAWSSYMAWVSLSEAKSRAHQGDAQTWDGKYLAVKYSDWTIKIGAGSWTNRETVLWNFRQNGSSKYSLTMKQEAELKAALYRWTVPLNSASFTKWNISKYSSANIYLNEALWLQQLNKPEYKQGYAPLGFRPGTGAEWEFGWLGTFKLRPLDLSNSPTWNQVIFNTDSVTFKWETWKKLAEETLDLMVQDWANRSDWMVIKEESPAYYDWAYALVYKKSYLWSISFRGQEVWNRYAIKTVFWFPDPKEYGHVAETYIEDFYKDMHTIRNLRSGYGEWFSFNVWQIWQVHAEDLWTFNKIGWFNPYQIYKTLLFRN